MGYFDLDAREMLEVYLLETTQLLEQLNGALLSSESKMGFSEAELHSVFRVMHTIKSSSAMMGLDQLSSMAHKLEDLFSYYREEYGMIQNAEPELFDLLYKAVDYIEGELDVMSGEDYQPASTAEIEKLTEQYLQKITKEEKEKTERAVSEVKVQTQIPEVFNGKAGVIVRVLFESGCRMENIRAFMLMRQINGICNEVESYPENLEKSQDCAEYIGKNGVFFRFVSDEKEKVLEMIDQGLFVSSREVVSDGPREKEQKQVKNSGTGDNDFMQVRTERLDQLQNLAAELLIATLSLDSILEVRGLTEIRENEFHQVNRLISDMENAVMAMRMIPVGRMTPRLQRILRDISRNQNKEVEFITNCGDIEADKSVVDYVSEALIHILRNAMDHGIETPSEREAAGKPRKGKIWFEAENSGGELRISVQDDGRGIDIDSVKKQAREKGLFSRPEKEYSQQELLELILTPGFTTNKEVTEYSGRGVGLDVVKSVLENAGGHLYIRSEQGKGSCFTITVPLSLATMECTRFFVGEYCFSVPARYVFRFLEYRNEKKNIQKENGRSYILIEERMVPLVDLREFYSIGGQMPNSAVIIYVRCMEKEGCIIVDAMYTQKRIVVKQLPVIFGTGFRFNTGMNGLSIMGNGRICAALDVEILLERYEREGTYGRNRYQ